MHLVAKHDRWKYRIQRIRVQEKRVATTARAAPSGTPAPNQFERIVAAAGDGVRRDARRMRELADRYRASYREALEDWMRMKSRLEVGLRAARSTGPAPERLRARHDQHGRELAVLQGRLQRLDITARQLDLLAAYLASADAGVGEPTLAATEEPADAVPLRIIQAQEGERQRLAEEIHDGPAQVLTNAIFQVEYLTRVIDEQPRAGRTELAFLRTMLRDGLDEIRGFIASLRPPAVDVGLDAAIAEMGSAFSARQGIAVEVTVEEIDGRLTPAQKASVLRIVQEALQNVRKHAAASHVRIALEGDRLVIGDNGRGFDVMRLASASSRNFGLQFMRERAELMGSDLQIESRQGEGTRILLRLPNSR